MFWEKPTFLINYFPRVEVGEQVLYNPSSNLNWKQILGFGKCAHMTMHVSTPNVHVCTRVTQLPPNCTPFHNAANQRSEVEQQKCLMQNLEKTRTNCGH